MTERKAHAALCIDVTGEVCPMTYVRTKLALETLEDGAVLEVHLRGEEPLRNLPRSAREEGHLVLALEPLSQDRWKLLLRKHRGEADADHTNPDAVEKLHPEPE